MVKRLVLSGLLPASIFAGVLLVPAAAAASGCTLTATSDPGHSVTITGSGFGPTAAVGLEITRSGTADGSQTLTSDANGAFTTSIDAGPGRGGDYTFTATSTSCSAAAEALAVETAGGLAGGAQPTPPTTDTAPGAPAGDTHGEGSIAVWVQLLAGVVAGALAVLGVAVRSRRARR